MNFNKFKKDFFADAEVKNILAPNQLSELQKIFDRILVEEAPKPKINLEDLDEIVVYTDGACSGNPGPGGWGVVFTNGDELFGGESGTTNNRMEMTAVIEALKQTPEGSNVTVFTDSQYVIKTFTENWKIKKNQDLWEILKPLVEKRHVKWEWVKGHNGDPLNERADTLAQTEAQIRK